MTRNGIVDHFHAELRRYEEELEFALSSPELRSAGAPGEFDGHEHIAHLRTQCDEYRQAIKEFG
jgi:hypothetical protein